MMVLVRRVCRICGHDTHSIVACGREDCDKASDVTGSAAIHDHCDQADAHGPCTTVGCMAESVPLGLINPAVGGDTSKAAASSTSMWQVRLARRSASPSNDRPLTTRFEAELLMFVLTGEKQRVDPVDVLTGLWLVTLPTKMASELQATGQLMAEHDNYYLEADTP